MVGSTLSNWAPSSSHPSTSCNEDTAIRESGVVSREDIYHIAFLLRQVLVPDLVPQILKYADIFSTSTFSKKQDLSVTREQSPQICLLTPPIWSPTRVLNPVVKVSFRIKARDDGLALGIGKSYFTAAVLRGRDLEHGGLSGYLNALDGVVMGSQRVICTNTTASDVFETHVVAFNRNGHDREEAAWVAELQAGDHIIVNAHAQWASFSNHVADVEVQVHTLVVVR